MNREQLITAMKVTASQVAKPRPVTVDGWGTVYIRPLTVADVDLMEEPEITKDADGKIIKDVRRLARSAARLICDEAGKRSFNPDSAEDIELLAAQPWLLLNEIFEAAKIVNGVEVKN